MKERNVRFNKATYVAKQKQKQCMSVSAHFHYLGNKKFAFMPQLLINACHSTAANFFNHPQRSSGGCINIGAALPRPASVTSEIT